MKRFDIKSLIAGIIIGSMGITTVFAATGIKSAILSNANVTLNGASLPLNRSLISVTMDDEQNASLYMPVNELLEKFGYTVNYDSEKNIIDLIPGNSSSHEVTGDLISDGNVVMNLTNNANQTNIAESGSFQAEDNQKLIINVTSDVKGGSIELFLFDPNGKEQRISIGSVKTSITIALKKGVWKYNCSGVFKEGGNVNIVGTIK
ncbi:hypothetical protein [Clostridium transplantifaecale]|uniref:hypothetical protein n=1 Tax=Clostridium transplantifaecale TaxID=2479838 RepID=UPI000F640250|nr:hypothetical protein [Clostridium transplantifaecale]